MPQRKKRLCLIPRFWDLTRWQASQCDNEQHHHVSKKMADKLVELGEAEWVKGGAGQVLRRTARSYKPPERLRDISEKMGEYFQAAYKRRENWAVAMLAGVRKQWERKKTRQSSASFEPFN